MAFFLTSEETHPVLEMCQLLQLLVIENFVEQFILLKTS